MPRAGDTLKRLARSPAFCLFLVALAARLAWVALNPPVPEEILTRLNDSTDYDLLARNLLAGEGFSGRGGNPSVIRAPLYPIFLALVYLLAGKGNLIAIAILQAFLSAGASVLTMLVARHLGAPRWAALLAGLADAMYPVFVYQSALILTESFHRAIQMAALLVTLRASLGTRLIPWFAAGLLWGGAALCRPAAIGIAAFVGIWILIAARPRNFARRLLVAAVFGMGCWVVLAPWTARNYAVSGRFVPVAANLPTALVHGTSHLSLHARRWFAGEDLIGVDEELLWHTQLRAFDGANEELAQQDAYLAMWKEFAKEHPGRLTRLSFLRVTQFWSPVIQNDSRAVRLAALMSMGPILLSGWVYAILGLFVVRWRPLAWRGALLCLLIAVAATLPHALSMPDVRYRTALIDPVWIAAGGAGLGILIALARMRTPFATARPDSVSEQTS